MSTCRLHPSVPQVDDAVVAALAGLPTTVASDQLGRIGGIVGIPALTHSPADRRLAGRAHTVWTRPGDNLVVHKAIDLAEAGDVLVVAAGGHLERAVMGEIVYRHAASRGIAGIVVDGAVRDSKEMAEGPIPVFARGPSPLGPHRHGPGEIRGDVVIAEAIVHQGDVIIGDADGIVVVPRARCADVAAAGTRQLHREETQLATASAGALDRAWLDDALAIELVDPAEVTDREAQASTEVR